MSSGIGAFSETMPSFIVLISSVVTCQPTCRPQPAMQCCGVQNQVPQVKGNRVPEDLENGAGARRANCTLEPQTSRCHDLRTTGQNDLILTALKSSDQGLSNEKSLTCSSQKSMEWRVLKVVKKVCKTLWFW